MGYQNSTFPLAIYGCTDTASRKILWLKIWVTNSDPQRIGYWYLEYLYEARIEPCYLRIDKGTETGTMATMHASTSVAWFQKVCICHLAEVHIGFLKMV